MLRTITSLITAYAIFVVTSLLLFKVSGQNPHQPVGLGFQLFTVAYGMIFSALSGLVVPLISRTKKMTLSYCLAFIIAGFATFSLVKSAGSHWSQLFAIVIFAPTSILGGLLYIRRSKKE